MESQENNEMSQLDLCKCYQIIQQLKSTKCDFSPIQIKERKELFWKTLREEVKKINNGYKQREWICVERFQMFDFQNFMIHNRDDSLSAIGLFQKTLQEIYPQFEIAQMSNTSANTENNNGNGNGNGIGIGIGNGNDNGNDSGNDENIIKNDSFSSETIINNNNNKEDKEGDRQENARLLAKFYCFCELLRDAHLLRDFTIQTFRMVAMLAEEMKQMAMDSNSLQEIAECDSKFRSLCDVELYNSTILVKLCTRTEVIATSLLCSHHGCAPQEKAFVCFRCHQLDQDMYVLRCFHRYCGLCIDQMKEQGCMDCITCGRHNVLKRTIKDLPLRAFIATHFSVKSASVVAQRQSNKMELPLTTSQVPTYLIQIHHFHIAQEQPQVPKNTTDSITTATVATTRRSGNEHGLCTKAKTSCHQCKNHKSSDELLFCKHVKWGAGKKPSNYVLKYCRKKFCLQCMSKYMSSKEIQDLLVKQQANEALTEWKCPACAEVCDCAACWRKRSPGAKSSECGPNVSKDKRKCKSKKQNHTESPNVPIKEEDSLTQAIAPPLSLLSNEHYGTALASWTQT